MKKYHFADTKPHYEILDGLRGVAALVVILYHVFECFDWSPAPHGYLAVDFFFVLSGFVIGYAYDDRWKSSVERKSLTIRGFFRRRLIRLHPMVVAGALIGAVCFLLQGSVRWDGTQVGLGWVMVALLLNMLMLPVLPGMAADVRGNGEMFPLNGPNWSLFFEYIGNILYALLLRRLPTKILAAVALVSGGFLAHIALRDGYLGVGWTMADGGFWSGLVRMIFPYTVGLLLARLKMGQKRENNLENGENFVENGENNLENGENNLENGGKTNREGRIFWLCGAIIVLVGCLPLLFGELQAWQNGLYDVLCVIAVFPLLVWLGASVLSVGEATQRVSRFLGDLSYPLYAIHYPLMYLFYAHIGFSGDLVPIARVREVWPEALLLPVACLLLAWLCFRFYDLPLRRRLTTISKK